MPKRRTLDVKLNAIQKKIAKSHRKSNGAKGKVVLQEMYILLLLKLC